MVIENKKEMILTKEDKQHLEDIYQSFLHNEKILRMKHIRMHRGSNCYEHSFKVAKKAIYHAIRYHKKGLNLESILLGSILHDYYLYDWRDDKSKKKKHGHNHPFIASENSSKDFNISKEVKDIIESHMWPINMKNFPKSKESRIVSNADKMVTIGESMTTKKHKQKKRETYLSYISHLF